MRASCRATSGRCCKLGAGVEIETPKEVIATLGIILGTVGSAPGCSSDSPDDPIDCPNLCQQLQEKGCELSTSVGAGGATQKGPGGCLDSCHQAQSLAVINSCTEGSKSLYGVSEQDRESDLQRQHDGRHPGLRCRAHGLGFLRRRRVRSGGRPDGARHDVRSRPYTLSYAWPQCACMPGTELGLGELGCGAEATCPEVCCCGGAVVARVCIADACVTGEEACAVLEAPPYSLCGAP